MEKKVDKYGIGWHELKTWPEFFDATRTGQKNFEIRKNDRNFQLGDYLILREWSVDGGYSGRSITRWVNYVLPWVPGFGLEQGYVILGTEKV